MKTITVKTPIRADLAGGTLDLWPIYLLLPSPMTINVGLSLFAQTQLKIKPGTGLVSMKSIDQNQEIKTQISSFLNEDIPSCFRLQQCLLEQAQELSEVHLNSSLNSFDLEFETHAKSPAGAGLGGSSSLNISLTTAILSWIYGWSTITPELIENEIIPFAQDCESKVLWGPAGLQDYYGAAYGGLQKLKWRAAHHQRVAYPHTTLKELESKLWLYYSGESRNSGINNWDLYKKFIDGDSEIQNKFKLLNDATHSLDQTLQNQDWLHVGKSIQSEWKVRSSLSPTISTPKIDEAFKISNSLDLETYKICGAGGGGCFFIYDEQGDLDKKDKLDKLFNQESILSLDGILCPEGIQFSIDE
ncbi:MAG: hypothetical protein CL678_17975 [Bdellovibrionaceae bacterium]|nr:hypothetical protein [Pseudobdellovibrionaceae bacterium]|tara:strand:+ start:4856 stop:5932 length:1077 start_codon:yes stop_codon:yes gene_type:complete